jgi:tellurite resistance protein
MTTSVQVGNTDKAQDVSYLQSIVHILDQSGALDKAKQNIIEADFQEVGHDDNT